MTDSYGTTNYSYDKMGRMTGVTDPVGENISYEYDSRGRKTKLIYPDGKFAAYEYDEQDRLVKVTDRDGRATTYAYDEAGRRKSTSLPNGITTIYTYDKASRIVEIESKKENGGVVQKLSYSHDGSDEKIWYMVEEYMVFYEMCKDDKYRDVHYVAGTDWSGIKCPKYKEHQRPSERIGKLRINLTTKNIGDFMSTFLSEWIISDKVLEILQNNDVKGFDIKPVEICNRKLQYRFWEFVITGKGGNAHSDSGIYLKYYCKYCNLKKYSAYKNGIIVDGNNWDGSDIFTITGYPRYILVTEKAKNIIEKNKLTGVRLIPSHELKWPEGVIKP